MDTIFGAPHFLMATKKIKKFKKKQKSIFFYHFLLIIYDNCEIHIFFLFDSAIFNNNYLVKFEINSIAIWKNQIQSFKQESGKTEIK